MYNSATVCTTANTSLARDDIEKSGVIWGETPGRFGERALFFSRGPLPSAGDVFTRNLDDDDEARSETNTSEARRNAYLEERPLGRQRRWNLNRVELLLEVGSVVVNVRNLDDDPRGRRQRRLAIVPYCHLEA